MPPSVSPEGSGAPGGPTPGVLVQFRKQANACGSSEVTMPLEPLGVGALDVHPNESAPSAAHAPSRANVANGQAGGAGKRTLLGLSLEKGIDVRQVLGGKGQPCYWIGRREPVGHGRPKSDTVLVDVRPARDREERGVPGRRSEE